MKENKSGGPSGIPSGLLKCLPENWLMFLTRLFNAVFTTDTCLPKSWASSRLITIFKKGSQLSCDNYRGISIMDSIAKLFDTILSQRLELWFQPDREQAGSQKGRGCLEHIVSLRLLIDYAESQRKRLYIVFIDFSKAYDRVPRLGLLQKMMALGCGRRMLEAVAATYSSTSMILGSALIEKWKWKMGFY